MPYNNISATLTAAERDAILVKLNEIKAVLPFLVNLTNDEKTTLPKMSDKTVPFVEKALSYCQNNPNLVPPYLDVNELQKDVLLYQTITPVLQAITQLATAITDTNTALGSEAYTASLTFYSTVRDAAKRNVPGSKAIYDDLRQRFPGGGGKNGDAGTPTVK